jgi:type II secretory ATPase GspE/PulE/Tfp pilus assembly ATPase PilB-like protein
VVLREHYDRFEAEAAGGASGSPGDRRLGATPRPGPPSSRIASARSAPTLSPAADDPIKAADQILRFTAERGATDIHLQRDDHGLKIRLRTDGLLHTVATLPAAAAPPLISRMKVLASMDIAERRLPQDGRFTMHLDREDLDVRVSSLPSQFGEKIVIRLLRKSTQLLQLDNLQLPPAIREAYQDAIDSATGFFLVTGPTGSGKTTTLYATLNALDRESLNITTLEDPIEYSLPGLTQVQIREDIELSFASGLRSILRQDPDVILVGEIRDLPTVEIACRAALTGHKVFSTLHTNDACQAVTRLLDMGVAPHLIAATLRGVLAQRLVRKICPECRTDYAPNETERAVLGHPPLDRLQYGQGCAACAGSGYRGRVAVFEYFRVDEPLRRLIMDRASPYALRHAAARNGMVNMAEFARRAALDGVTTVAEIQRAVLADDGKDQFCSDCQRTISIDFSVCPFCKHVLKGKCQNCAAPIEANWQACPSCGEALARDWERIYCRHCLAPVQPAWSECHYCGGEL